MFMLCVRYVFMQKPISDFYETHTVQSQYSLFQFASGDNELENKKKLPFCNSNICNVN